MSFDALFPAASHHGRRQIDGHDFQAVLQEVRTVLARPGSDLQQPPTTLTLQPVQERRTLCQLPRGLFAPIAPLGTIVIRRSKRTDHIGEVHAPRPRMPYERSWLVLTK